jgi:hypothetical protein
MTRRTPRGSLTTGPTTRRHRLPRLHARKATCGECGRASRRTYCEVCGYELVRRTRAGAPKVPNV